MRLKSIRKTVCLTLHVFFLTVISIPPAGAQGTAEGYYQTGQNYLYGKNGVRQDQKKAIDYFEKAASMGHEQSQLHLGASYLRGTNGHKRNGTQAVKWLEKAAASGNNHAQYLLGWAYHDRVAGVNRDYNKAHEYYRAAAANPRGGEFSDLARRSATTGLARLYEEGAGCEKDPDKALELYTQSARQNDHEAQFRLGRLYIDGKDIIRDEETALIWLKKAALLGHAGAQDLLKKRYAIDVFKLSQKEKDELYVRFSGPDGHLSVSREPSGATPASGAEPSSVYSGPAAGPFPADSSPAGPDTFKAPAAMPGGY